MAGKGSQSPNHREGLSAVSSITGSNEYVYSTNHQLNVAATVVSETTTNANIYYGQKTSNTSAVQLTAVSHTLLNGIIVQALSTNVASIYVGDSSVLTSTGFELQPGQATSMAINNQNLVYVIGANNTDGITWIGN